MRKKIVDRKYEWKPGYRGVSKSAEAFGAVISEIKKHHGGTATPQKVVEAARPKDSPIHNLFEWNDGRAAELYRVEQARGYFRFLVTVTTDAEGNEQRERAYVHVQHDGESTYMATAMAMSDEELAKGVLDELLAKAKGILDTLNQLALYRRNPRINSLRRDIERIEKKIRVERETVSAQIG